MPTFDNIEITATTDITFDVSCQNCGADLNRQAIACMARNRDRPKISVKPCAACLAAAREEERKAAEEEVRRSAP